MTGDYTKVPLRPSDRWTGARMQQGRVLLDHDWNLNLDAAARRARETVRDAIGWAGVVAGSTAFQVSVTTTGDLDLDLEPGHFWLDGLEAFAPAAFTYSGQDAIAALPETGTVLVYLDVFEEHVQPAEDPSELVDPALGTIDTTGRTRVGFRVRVAPTGAATCAAAWAALETVAGSTGLLSVARGTIGTPDPCAPPGDPLAQIPDGLLRVEVLDGGTEATARFAWSYENGSCAVPVVQMPSGNTVQLAPSNLNFGQGDLVEISYLARRTDRVDNGALYLVDDVTPGAGGDTLTLHTAVTLPPPTPPATVLDGLCARRWNGEVVGAAAATNALWAGQDMGVTFTAGSGDYVVSDWWGARLRSESGNGIEERVAASPDGTGHSFAPLALVDLGARTVLSDCRPTFTSLVDLDFSVGACTVSVKPGDDLQAAIDSLPPGGGELCLAAGVYALDTPVRITGRERIVINGAGPASVIVAQQNEAAVVFDSCEDVEVRDVSVQGGSDPDGSGDPDLDGALTFLSCLGVVVKDCALSCPDLAARTQTCLTVRSATGGRASDSIRIERNQLTVGAWQTGILVVDAATQTISDNTVQLSRLVGKASVGFSNPTVGTELARRLRAGLRAKAGAGVTRVTATGSEDHLYVVRGSDAETIAREFADKTTAAKIRRAGGAEKAVLRFARTAGQGKQLAQASEPLRAIVGDVVATVRAVGQGIVVAGTNVGTVRIDSNLVESAVQGIHLGVSDATLKLQQSMDTVVVTGNIVHSLVPAEYSQDRHGVFVGNSRSTHILDTIATLRRLGSVPAGATPTSVEGIRVYGVLGPYLCIRESSLAAFDVGVRVVALPAVPQSRMWLVAETFADGASIVVDAPAAAVAQQRNPT
jgi:Family of unknown function (DUF6519)